MSSEQPLQLGRRRRAHKRSRNGCLTCKQRHIRCDEQKPVCTNCLVRGGDCGYPETGVASASSSATASGPGSSREPGQRQRSRQGAQLSRILPATPADPFDALPVEMPHRSMELFHHFTHYRIMSRTLVRKSPDSTCVGIAMHGPGTFRACLLLAAMHYSWMEGSISSMEETYLYHKVEAMRLVNEQIGDPVLSTSDGCINTIAALAVTESTIGDIEAAEAHINGLHTLLNIWRPDGWQHRFYGIVQRAALVAGSFISAAKPLDVDDVESQFAELSSTGRSPRDKKLSIRPTGPLFTTGPFDPTDLSPFYIGSPPDIEACNSDAEACVILNALRRLSSLPIVTGRTAPREDSSSQESSPRNSPDSVEESALQRMPPKQVAVLLRDAEAYAASLLFKPSPISLDTAGAAFTNSPSPSPSPSESIPIDPALRSQPSSSRSSSHLRAPGSHAVGGQLSINVDPYPDLDATIFPITSRSWAVASYFYLHFILRNLWMPPQPVDINLLHLLLDKLRNYISRTEEAMKLGIYSRDSWIWEVMIGAYALTAVQGHPAAPRAHHIAMRSGMPAGIWGVGERGEFDARRGAAAQEQEESEEEEDSDEDEDGEEEYADEGDMRSVPPLGWQPDQPQESLAEMRAWFEERIGVWSRTTGITSWEQAKESSLSMVTWPREFSGDAVLAHMWRNGIQCSGMVSPFAALDPRLS